MTLGSQQGREYPRFKGRFAATLFRSQSLHRLNWEGSLDCEEGMAWKDIRSSASLAQSLEREVDAAPQLVDSRCVATGEDASLVLIEEAVVAGSFFAPRSQHFATLVPVEASEARVDGASGVASVAQVLVENTAFFKPDRGVARMC